MGEKFKKGHEKLGGRVAGVPNKKTRAWEELGEYIVNQGADRYVKIMQAAEDDKFQERFERVLEYFQPKLGRNEQKIEIEGKQLFIGLPNDKTKLS